MALKRPKYAVFGPRGMTALFCKGCGAVIGDMQRSRFTYRKEFAQTTIEFEDGSGHVTNGCYTCLMLRDTPESLQEWYDADINFDPASYRAADVKRVIVGRSAVETRDEVMAQI